MTEVSGSGKVRVAGDPRGKQAAWTLLPPGVLPGDPKPEEGACSQCLRPHEPDQPHNPQSLHYQYSFYAEYDRWPNWGDAMAHCDDNVQNEWRMALREHGVEEEKLWPTS